jgi:hypothetical protein
MTDDVYEAILSTARHDKVSKIPVNRIEIASLRSQ